MDKTIDGKVLITSDDMQVSAAIVGARFSDPEREADRLAAARSFLNSAFELERALRLHTRCALVNHCGTLGAHNLENATEQLSRALTGYAASIRELAARSRAAELKLWEPPTAPTPAQAERVHAI
ncbi:MAG: hypothetical protein ACRENP_04710 [Longimicrobiales bacterium]